MMRVMIVICNVHKIWLKVVLGALFAQNERRAEGSKLEEGRVTRSLLPSTPAPQRVKKLERKKLEHLFAAIRLRVHMMTSLVSSVGRCWC